MTDVATITRGEFLRGRMTDIQSQLTELQIQVATGKKADLPSTHGPETRALLNLRLSRDTAQSYISTIEQTEGRMDTIQRILSRVSELASQVRAGINTVNNPTALANGPSSIPLKTQATNAIREIVDLLNEAPDGRFLFAGFAANTPPMLQPGSITQPTTPLGQVAALAVGTPLDNTLASGDTLYDAVGTYLSTTGNYYVGDTNANARVTVRVDHGFDIAYGVRGDDPTIRTILQALYAVATNDLSSATEGGWNRLASRASMDLEAAVKQMSQIQGDLGQKQASVKAIAERHKIFANALTGQIDDIERVDPADAIQRIGVLQTQLQTSYRLIANLRDLSLTNYL